MFDMIILVYGSNEGCQNTTRWPAYRQEMWVGGGEGREGRSDLEEISR